MFHYQTKSADQIIQFNQIIHPILQNNEKIMRYKDRLNELKTIQESIYRMHEVHLQDSDRIKDATDVHFIRPYVQYLGHRGTRVGRNHKTKKPRTRKNTHRH